MTSAFCSISHASPTFDPQVIPSLSVMFCSFYKIFQVEMRSQSACPTMGSSSSRGRDKPVGLIVVSRGPKQACWSGCDPLETGASCGL